MRSLAIALTSVAIAACAAPPIDDNLDTGGDVKLPDRTSQPPTDGGTTQNGDGSTTPPPPSNVSVTVNLTGTGTGTVTSMPAGLTCTGKTCKGSFAVGTKVTLSAAPASGVVFTAWSGACTGAASCVANADADVTLGAELVSLAGTWAGTYTNTRMAVGCTFNNKGNLSTTIKATGAAIEGTESISGLELRQIQGCSVVGSTSGAAPSEAVTVAGNTLTGTWTFAVQGGGTLAFPYTATVTAAGITGKWTCATCTGAFTLTKP
jgi:hypothetical protein